MSIPILAVCGKYQISKWKGLVATIALTATGTTGTFCMYFIENGHFGGLSFYGAVFLVPIVFTVVAPLLRIPYGEITDLCAVGECIMLALMKVHCILGGCCIGRELFTTKEGMVIRIPSRTMEILAALVIFAVLYTWVLKHKKNGVLYPWYLILYGNIRFVLNIFREAWVTKEMLLPFGNIWSLVAITIGVLWLIGSSKIKRLSVAKT